MSSLNLKEALENYSEKSSVAEIINGLQRGVYIHGIQTSDKSVFQDYLISLLNAKSSEELKIAIVNLQLQIPNFEIGLKTNISKNTDKLSKSLDDLKSEISNFSKSSSKASKTLVIWTVILSISTVILAFATVALVFVN